MLGGQSSVGMEAGGRWRYTGCSLEVPGLATAVGDPAAVGSLGTMVEHIFGYHMDRMARHLHAGAGFRGSDLTARGRAS
jgi:hypothetical protein